MTRERHQALPRVVQNAGSALILAAVFLGAGVARATDYGKTGEPVHLVVGYQPYGTENLDAIVLRAKELWKKYLPVGSTVEMQVALQGPIIVNNMLAGKQQIGFMGDMPSIAATTKQSVSDLRIVAVNSVDPMCQYVLVRSDAPQFKDENEALHWLDNKVIGVPKGTCADRFLSTVINQEHLKPAEVLNQSNELIVSGFRTGKLDGAVTWEPYIGKLVADKMARVIANGQRYEENNVTFVVMRADLIEQRPDVVKNFLNAELDAQLFISDPRNQEEIVDLFVTANPRTSKRVFWSTLYGTYPGEEQASKVRLSFAFTFTPAVMKIIAKDVTFLHSIKSIDVEQLRPEAVMPKFADEILNERGLKSPVGQVLALPANPYAD
jgi:NitT/TauT family transport system substrate-binding protein